MKNTIKLFVIAFAILLSSNVSASVLNNEVEEIQNAYKAASDITADFTQKTYIKLVEKDVIKKGRMNFKRGGKFRITYKGKNEKSYVSNGKFLWVFIPGDASSLVTYEVNKDTVPKEAMKFLTSFDSIKRDFSISPSQEFTNLTEGESALYLKPKSKKSHFKALDARFNKNHILGELIVHNNSGNVSRYTFTNISLSKGLSDSMFEHGSGKATPDILPR